MIQVNTENIVKSSQGKAVGFKAGFIELQRLQREMYRRIGEETGLSYFAIRNRMVGITKISKLEREAIDKVFAELMPGLNPWTGIRI